MPRRWRKTLGLQALRQRGRRRAKGRRVRRRQRDALRGGTGLQRGVEVRIVGRRTMWFARPVRAIWRRAVAPGPAGHRRWLPHAVAGQTALKRTVVHALRGRIGMRRGRSWRGQGHSLLLSTGLHRGQIARTRWRWWWRTTLCLWWRGRRRWPAGRRAAETGAAAQAKHCEQCTDGNGCGACLDHRRSPWLDGACAYRTHMAMAGCTRLVRESVASRYVVHLPLRADRWRAPSCSVQDLGPRQHRAASNTQGFVRAVTRPSQGLTHQFSTTAWATSVVTSAASAGNDANTALRKRAANAASLAW